MDKLAPCPLADELEALAAKAEYYTSGGFALLSHLHAHLPTILAALRAQPTADDALVERVARERVAALETALTTAREAIASLDEFVLGGVDVPDFHSGEIVGQYGIRDELLSKIDALLKPTENHDGQ